MSLIIEEVVAQVQDPERPSQPQSPRQPPHRPTPHLSITDLDSDLRRLAERQARCRAD